MKTQDSTQEIHATSVQKVMTEDTKNKKDTAVTRPEPQKSVTFIKTKELGSQ